MQPAAPALCPNAPSRFKPGDRLSSQPLAGVRHSARCAIALLASIHNPFGVGDVRNLLQNQELFQDKPAKSLLKAWSKKMANGSAIMIPVFIGGKWTLQVPRGNKRVLQVPIETNKN